MYELCDWKLECKAVNFIFIRICDYLKHIAVQETEQFRDQKYSTVLGI